MNLEANDWDEEASHTSMADARDTEITLGTGKMLGLFFGLVVLCSVFFALGFKLGRGSVGSADPSSPTASSTGTKSGSKPATIPTVQDNPPPQTLLPDSAAKSSDTSSAASADQSATSSSATYFVQVAAVSKQEDADALVDALKKKQYAAFSATLADKLFHIQVGPFSDIKEAEATRAKLVGDGYNPILKK